MIGSSGDFLSLARRLPRLGDRTRIRPVGPDPLAHVRWVDRDLCSMIEGFFGEIVDPDRLDDTLRASLTARLPRGWLLPPATVSGGWGTRCWLLEHGHEIGTLSLHPSLGDGLVGISSLYVEPGCRGGGAATRALQQVEQAAVQAGFRGIGLSAEWSWFLPARLYLRQGFWVRLWKRSLSMERGPFLPPRRLVIEGDDARLSLLTEAGEAPLLSAGRRGERLHWESHPAFDALLAESSGWHLALVAEATFSLALALEGWPLIRSEEAWLAARMQYDVGGPESLARAIASWVAEARRQGIQSRAPEIPGLARRLPDLEP